MSNKVKSEKIKPAETVRPFTAVILAAGKGTRMKSPLPKVLHPVAGEPMINNVVKACLEAGVTDVRVVIGHGGPLVKQVIEPLGVHCYTQVQQFGTANAVKSAQIESLEGDVVILNGDHPLLEASDLKSFIQTFREEKLDLAVVTVELRQPKDFGRIVRHQGRVVAIVEAKDASADTLKIREVNTGIYVVRGDVLSEYLPQIENNNMKQEFYLTDLVSLCVESQLKVAPIRGHKRVSFGVNTQAELAQATRLVFRKKSKTLLDEGVLMLDPSTTYIERSVEVGPGAVIYPNVYLRGKTKLASFCVIEPNCYIVDSEVGESTQIRAGSYLEKAKVHNRCVVGPYARLRPETEIMDEAQVGNFVELKKVKFGKKSKAAHLTYLGDAEIGENVNIGCGTITCNYSADKKKYRTVIGNGVFVGSDTQFVAPINVGDFAVIGSGSTITKDVPARSLAVARAKQFIKENYVKVEAAETDQASDSASGADK